MSRLTQSSPYRHLFAIILFPTILLGAWLLQARVQSAQDPIANSPAAPEIAAQPMTVARDSHTATLLPNGKVLVAGGRNPNGPSDASGALVSAQLYDPATGRWEDAAPLTVPRFNHTAVLLQNGRVLVAGGQNAGGYLNAAEIYDPVNNLWGSGGTAQRKRARATATLLALPNVAPSAARVLVVGGENESGYLRSFELYNPATGMWTEPAQLLNSARRDHTATRLSNGRVVVIGGGAANNTPLDTAELFDTQTNRWVLATRRMNGARRLHTATLLADGKILVAGGSSDGANSLDTAALFDPQAQAWEALANKMINARRSHSATLLPDGRVLVAFGRSAMGGLLNTLEVYDPDTKRWASITTRAPGDNSLEPRANHTATILAGGRVLLAGGSGDGTTVRASVELFENSGPTTGNWSPTGNPMRTARHAHTATLLPNGLILVAGGNTASSGAAVATSSAELFNPASGIWMPTADLKQARFGHTATLLPNGKVLVAGGSGGSSSLNTAELYDPVTGAWMLTSNNGNNMTAARQSHTATLLRDGRVLVAGGRTASPGVNSAEIFNPATGIWTGIGVMRNARQKHTATLLPNSQVLIVGGTTNDGDSPGGALGRCPTNPSDPNFTASMCTAETYDPATGLWTRTGNLRIPRKWHTATLLANGKVFAASGLRGSGALLDYRGSGELYDPVARNWTEVNQPQNRIGHTATLLLNGKVMLTGGYTRSDQCGEFGRFDTDVYDPAAGTSGLVFASDSLNQTREAHTATLLTNGQVLVIGGLSRVCNVNTGNVTQTVRNDAELFDVGLGDIESPTRPVVTRVTWTGPGNAMTLEGIRFQGISEASGGGTQNSATNFPLVQLRSIANEQTLMLTPDPAAGRGWTNNNYFSVAVPTSFPPGPALLTVFVNGIPSVAQILAPGATGLPATISISGRIYDVNGAGFQSTVTLRSSTGLLLTTQTAATGEYVFPNLPASAPSQTSSTLTPSSTNAGSGGLTLVVDGRGFNANSVVLWNGQQRTTTFVSPTRVTAFIPASDLATPGIASIVVLTGGAYTTPLTFTVAPQASAPTPRLTSITPAAANAGGAAFTLAVAGTGFVPSSRVRWNGLDRATTFVSATQLTAQITANDILNPGTASVTVFTPAPGGGLSNALSFAINAPPAVAGSVLLYPVFSSAEELIMLRERPDANAALSSPEQNPYPYDTTISITNVNTQQSVGVRMFFVNGETGTVARNLLINLGPNLTQSFFAGTQAGLGVNGYVIAVAVDSLGCPIRFNFLRGSESINLFSRHQATLSAVQVAALAVPACSAAGNSATLNFDGVTYERLPIQVTADFIPSAADGNRTRLIVNSLAGDLRSSATALGQLSGLLTDDAENSFSFTIQESAPQLFRELSSTFPFTTPRFTTIIPAGRTGSLRLSPLNRTTGPALFGAVLLYREQIGSIPSTGGYVLRTTDVKQSHSLIIPKPPAGPSFAHPRDPDALAAAPAPGETPQQAGAQQAEPLAAAPDETAQQTGAIIYTITPSGSANNGRPVVYAPTSRTVSTGAPGPSFAPEAPEQGGFSGQDFWAQYAALEINGAISGLNGALPDVNLQLLDHALYLVIPNELITRTVQANSVGGFQFAQVFINGLYRLTPMSAAFSFNPVDRSLPPATENQTLTFEASSSCQAAGIAAQPAPQMVCAGAPASFAVTPSGTGPFTYQWRRNNVAIDGANSSGYAIASATLANAGNYDVVVTGACGMAITSLPALLTVNEFTLTPMNTSFQGNGGTGSVNVMATVNTCTWTAMSSAPAWLTITSGASDTGNGLVNFSVAANNTGDSRSAMLTIAGQQVAVMQAGAAPQLSALNRDSAMIGSPAFTLTITGTNFTANSKVRWQGSERNTGFVSATQLTAEITEGDLATAGTFSVDVLTPSAGASNALIFTVIQNYEADVSPPPLGNGAVTTSDWVRVGRFAAGLETPATGSEFQRADCAPLDTRGNGALSVADWVLAGRYAAGLIAVNLPAGPTAASAFAAAEKVRQAAGWSWLSELIPSFKPAPGGQPGEPRQVAAGPPHVLNLRDGQRAGRALRHVVIELDGPGGANALGFSVSFDAVRWRLLTVSAGRDAASAQLLANTQEAAAGRVGIALALPSEQTWPEGARQLAVLTLAALTGAAATRDDLVFADYPVAREMVDAQANALATVYQLGDRAAVTLVSAADANQRQLARAAIVAAYGVALATTAQTATAQPLPTELAGTQVVLRDHAGTEHAAALFYVSATQINFLIPAEAALGWATVLIRNEAGVLALGAAEIVATAPSLFSADASGAGWPAATLLRVRGDGSVSYEAVTRYDEQQRQPVALPIEFGNDDEQLFLLLFGTGLRNHRGAVTAEIGALAAPVLYAGAQGEWVGLDQFNLSLPRALMGRGEVELKLNVGGRETNSLRLLIK